MLVSDQERLKADIECWASEWNGQRCGLLPIAQRIQAKYKHISEYAMQLLADQLGIHPVEVDSVVSFYSFLSNRPQGSFIIRLCRTISCGLAGGARVANQLQNELGVGFGETTPDGKFSLEWTNCLGMCDQGPAMLVNEQVFTKVTPEKVHDIIELCRSSFGPHALQERRKEQAV